MTATQDRLVTPISRVRAVLAEVVEGQEMAWLEKVRGVLEVLVRALRDHIKGDESPNGSLTTLNGTQQDAVATLDREVKQLRNEHVDLLDSASALLGLIESQHSRILAHVSDGVDSEAVTKIHNLCTALLDRLDAHNDYERNLFVTVSTRDEPGGGD